MRTLPTVALLALPLTASLAAQEQPPSAVARPRIGLVLSGGGARGAAHVGVLKVLEEARVPVDCVAGTSMGAIVGGLYALGYSPAELEEVVRNIDWQAALRDDPPRRALSFRRKQDDYDFLADFSVGLRGGKLRFPRGLIQGQTLNLLLRELAGLRDTGLSFDDLPTPFRAIATDAVNGQMVVLGRGDIVAAMRASMSVPGVFAPVALDKHVLIDGGISNNLPVEVARAMGADIIIAVDISFPLLLAADLESAIELSNQALTILMRRETDRQLRQLTGRDVTIVPDLGLLGSGDFAASPGMIEPGAVATRAQLPRLRELALSEPDYLRYLASRRPVAPDSQTVARIEVKDPSRLADRVLEDRLETRAGGTLEADVLHDDISRLYGLGIYESVDYALSDDNGETGVRITTRPKSWGPNYINFGVNLLDDFEGSSSYNIGARLTRTGVNPLGGEWRIDAQLGNNPAAAAEFYQPLSYNSRFFVAPNLALEKFDSRLFAPGSEDILAEYRISIGRYGIDLGYLPGNRAELRMGVVYEDGRGRRRIGESGLDRFKFYGGRFEMLARYDDLDSTAFPRAGTRASFAWQASRGGLGSPVKSDRLIADWVGVVTRGAFSYTGWLRLGSNLEGRAPIQDLFELGGLFNLSGLRTGQLRGQHYGVATVSGYRRFDLSANLDMPVYIGASLESGNAWNDSQDIALNDLRYAGSVFFGVDTPIGPLYLAVGASDKGDTSGYFFLGQSFGREAR